MFLSVGFVKAYLLTCLDTYQNCSAQILERNLDPQQD
jgi:hypothetical protein